MYRGKTGANQKLIKISNEVIFYEKNPEKKDKKKILNRKKITKKWGEHYY